MITLIVRGLGRGKTTESLIALHKAGGGIYFTRDVTASRQAMMIADRLDLKGIKVLVSSAKNIVIDDDSVNVIVTQTDKREIKYNG